ncbi:glycoside hydrolase family 2 TIM barrel-domain containing protein [Spirosoma pollinicola]|nr:glycoside hydrolase family 2 TIM barrel-domain containing protein [Spirosoma pollinicola]
MIKKIITLAPALLFVFTGMAQTTPSARRVTPVNVEVKQNGNQFQLLRAGQPYFVQGAGGSQYPDRIAAYGGNSIRTWGSTNGQAVLDTAQKYGLTVLMGLDVARERHGFNYEDSAAVKKQLEKLRAEVMTYRNHPALLAWGIGNELNLQYKNPKVWDAVNQISQMIHTLDPNHPTCTVLAGINKVLVDNIRERCPDIDFLSVNTYGGLATLPKAIAGAGWAGAYMVTEWGPTGHWEGLSTTWHSPIEETSSEKAAVYKSRYEASIDQDRDKCLGSYVFLWGQKQERTPTWYGLFTEKGEETEVVDVLHYLWSGHWPANQAPHLYSLQLDGKKAVQNVSVKMGATYPVLAVVTDPDQDPLSYCWEVLPEPTKVGEGGDYEAKPKPVANAFFHANNQGQASLKAPAKPGAYRLFVYVSDGHNKVATANLPFYVNQ